MLVRSLGKKANSVGVMFGANAAASSLSLIDRQGGAYLGKSFADHA